MHVPWKSLRMRLLLQACLTTCNLVRTLGYTATQTGCSTLVHDDTGSCCMCVVCPQVLDSLSGGPYRVVHLEQPERLLGRGFPDTETWLAYDRHIGNYTTNWGSRCVCVCVCVCPVAAPMHACMHSAVLTLWAAHAQPLDRQACTLARYARVWGMCCFAGTMTCVSRQASPRESCTK